MLFYNLIPRIRFLSSFYFNTILRFAVGLWELCDFWGRLANLAFVPFTKIATLPHCSPKAESFKKLNIACHHRQHIPNTARTKHPDKPGQDKAMVDDKFANMCRPTSVKLNGR